MTTPEWQERIAEAQLEPTIRLDGRLYTRRKYGHEVPDPKLQCADCGVWLGMFHVLTCDVERCPRCDGQLVGCDCESDDEEDES